jgi:hypothetical protein
MKTVITILLTLFFAAQSFAQETVQNKVLVNGVDINSLDLDFVEIVGVAGFMSNKVTVMVYYGQQIKFLTSEDQRIESATGKVEKFNGMIDALNFMAKNGWEYRDAYIVTSNNQNVYHYILKKKV